MVPASAAWRRTTEILRATVTILATKPLRARYSIPVEMITLPAPSIQTALHCWFKARRPDLPPLFYSKILDLRRHAALMFLRNWPSASVSNQKNCSIATERDYCATAYGGPGLTEPAPALYRPDQDSQRTFHPRIARGDAELEQIKRLSGAPAKVPTAVPHVPRHR